MKASCLAQVRQRKISRYMDYFMDVTSIKDDDCLVAYRLPNKGRGKTRLQVSNRWIESNWGVPDRLKGPERKFCGSPLVTNLGEESLSCMYSRNCYQNVATLEEGVFSRWSHFPQGNRRF